MVTTSTEVRLHGSEVHVLHSDAVGDDFELSVFPPLVPVDGPVPVVYCTDATLTVGMAADVVRLLQGGGEIPPVRLVCVGYPIGDDLTQFVRLRTRDFMPTSDPVREAGMSATGGDEVRGGGAGAFLQFLTSELHPWVEAN